LPGGAVEPGETLEEAVVREVAEEIGLSVEVVEVVAVLDRIFWDQEGVVQYHYVLIDFLCRKTGGKLQASSDVISCSQVPFSALAQYNLTKETKGVISRAYQRVSGGSPPIYRVKAATSIQS
jgi:ADP-ribose pyrophosphatase YjhB (NUDIX family)